MRTVSHLLIVKRNDAFSIFVLGKKHSPRQGRMFIIHHAVIDIHQNVFARQSQIRIRIQFIGCDANTNHGKIICQCFRMADTHQMDIGRLRQSNDLLLIRLHHDHLSKLRIAFGKDRQTFLTDFFRERFLTSRRDSQLDDRSRVEGLFILTHRQCQ